jgi:hypothetical protein
MRRRLASPVPPFDIVPAHVVEAAKRVFVGRIRRLETVHGSGSAPTAEINIVGLPLRQAGAGLAD